VSVTNNNPLPPCVGYSFMYFIVPRLLYYFAVPLSLPILPITFLTPNHFCYFLHSLYAPFAVYCTASQLHHISFTRKNYFTFFSFFFFCIIHCPFLFKPYSPREHRILPLVLYLIIPFKYQLLYYPSYINSFTSFNIYMHTAVPHFHVNTP